MKIKISGPVKSGRSTVAQLIAEALRNYGAYVVVVDTDQKIGIIHREALALLADPKHPIEILVECDSGPRPGANAHGIGPDTDGGPNPDYTPPSDGYGGLGGRRSSEGDAAQVAKDADDGTDKIPDEVPGTRDPRMFMPTKPVDADKSHPYHGREGKIVDVIKNKPGSFDTLVIQLGEGIETVRYQDRADRWVIDRAQLGNAIGSYTAQGRSLHSLVANRPKPKFKEGDFVCFPALRLLKRFWSVGIVQGVQWFEGKVNEFINHHRDGWTYDVLPIQTDYYRDGRSARGKHYYRTIAMYEDRLLSDADVNQHPPSPEDRPMRSGEYKGEGGGTIAWKETSDRFRAFQQLMGSDLARAMGQKTDDDMTLLFVQHHGWADTPEDKREAMYEWMRKSVAHDTAWIQVAVESNKAITEYLRSIYPDLSEAFGMPVDGVRVVIDWMISRITDWEKRAKVLTEERDKAKFAMREMQGRVSDLTAQSMARDVVEPDPTRLWDPVSPMKALLAGLNQIKEHFYAQGATKGDAGKLLDYAITDLMAVIERMKLNTHNMSDEDRFREQSAMALYPMMLQATTKVTKNPITGQQTATFDYQTATTLVWQAVHGLAAMGKATEHGRAFSEEAIKAKAEAAKQPAN